MPKQTVDRWDSDIDTTIAKLPSGKKDKGAGNLTMREYLIQVRDEERKKPRAQREAEAQAKLDAAAALDARIMSLRGSIV